MEEDVSEDEEKELLEDELHLLQKVDSVATIDSLRMKPGKLFAYLFPFAD